MQLWRFSDIFLATELAIESRSLNIERISVLSITF